MRLFARHGDAAQSCWAESKAAVIGKIANQQNNVVTELKRPAQAFAHQPVADADIAPVGGNGDRPQQQSRGHLFVAHDGDRPMPHGSHQPVILADHQAELAHRRRHVAIAVGLLAVPVGAKSLVQQRINGCVILGLFEVDGGVGH